MDGITIKIMGLSDVAARLRQKAEGMQKAMARGLKKATARVLKRAQQTVYEGHASGHLNVGTGYLRQNLTMAVDDQQLLGYVGVRKNVIYARIHEYGGRTKPHRIEPVRAQALRWLDGEGSPVFARYVEHPGSNIPARPYLHPALDAEQEGIRTDLADAVQELLQ